MTIEPKKNLKVIVISDGTGETATAMTRAAITQFPDKEIFFTRFKNVRTKEQIHTTRLLKTNKFLGGKDHTKRIGHMILDNTPSMRLRSPMIFPYIQTHATKTTLPT